MGSKILAIETQNPGNEFSQYEILKHVEQCSAVSTKALGFYRRFLSDSGIENRYFGLDNLGQVDFETPDQAILRFQHVASQIGSDAVIKCLERSGYRADEIDGLIVTTCTGYLCPGLSSYIAQKTGMRENIYTSDLVGIGCAAAIPALRAADLYLKAHPDHRVMVVSVEVSSAALSWGDKIDLILSNSIFADGAAACLMACGDAYNGFEIQKFESLLWPQYRDELRFEHKNSRLSNVISRRVPGIAAEAVQNLYVKLSQAGSLTFQHFAFHPGGRKILDKIQTSLKLSTDDMVPSRETLRCYGNMSSPSVLYVLKYILEKQAIQDGDNLILFSFGAGFTAFGAALRFCAVPQTVSVCASFSGGI